jgi:MFS family permease
MAVVASAFGLIAFKSIWYPINLLAAVVYAQSLEVTTEQMAAFHFTLLMVAVAIHISTSLLVGVLYGALLPMFPRRPILLGGFLAPLLWSGLLYTMLEYINPVLNQRINWWWFVASQFAFGITAGFVVAKQQRIRTLQNFPFAVLAGIEAPGAMHEHGDSGEQK